MGAERWLAEMMAQLPPLGEAEFAGSRPVALREQADVEALVKLARTFVRLGHHWLGCQCTTCRFVTLAASSGNFGAKVL